MAFLKAQFDKYGLNELHITSDGLSGLYKGAAPGALKTINFYNSPAKNLGGLLKKEPNKPLMVTEYWAGWFDHWGERHHTQDIKVLKEKLVTILQYYNASINFYMFVGGTNFEFWNGANGGRTTRAYAPTITSYDYDAAISESGDTTPKYFMIKRLIASLGLAPMDVPEVPQNSPKLAYGIVMPTESMGYTDMVKLVPKEKVTVLSSPTTMENLDINAESGQGYGYLLYQKVVSGVSAIHLNGTWLDRAIVMYNNEKVATYDWTQTPQKIRVSGTGPKNTLDVLVENMGRINFKQLSFQRKGISGSLYGDGLKLVNNWWHAALEFEEQYNRLLSESTKWETYRPHSTPAAYRATLTIHTEPRDTFLDMADWTKGIVIVNGYNIGRYWERGPQQTLYVPAPLLNKGPNEFIVFETEGVKSDKRPTLLFSNTAKLQCDKCGNKRAHSWRGLNKTSNLMRRAKRVSNQKLV